LQIGIYWEGGFVLFYIVAKVHPLLIIPQASASSNFNPRRQHVTVGVTLSLQKLDLNMTEIHNQFDTIIILDFGSQVHSIQSHCSDN
jgi:hypothetical protein